MRQRSMLTMLIAAAVAGGCADAAGPTGAVDAPGTVAMLRIAQGTGAVTVGDTMRLRAEALDRDGRVVPGVQVAWATTDSSVAVIEDGLLVPVREGRVQILATARGTVSMAQLVANQGGTTAESVSIAPAAVSLGMGGSEQLTATLRFTNGMVVRLRASPDWRSLDTTVATVRNGLVVGKGHGSTAVVVDAGTHADTVQVTVSKGVVTIPASIDATGTADVTDALNAFFASVPDSSVIRFPGKARYRVEGTLLFKDRRALTFEGNGATVFAMTDGSGATPPDELKHKWPRRRSFISFIRGEGITVRDLTLRGANPVAGVDEAAFRVELEAQHGVELLGVRNARLQGMTITDVWGDFAYVGSYGTEQAAGVTIVDNRFERNGRQGIGITSGEDILIERNYVGEVRRATIDLEPNTANNVIRRLTIRNNVFGPGRLTFIASQGAAGTIDGVFVEDNKLVGKQMLIIVKPPEGSRRSNFRILRNVSDKSYGSTMPLMRFTRIDGLEVRDNVAPLQAGRNMIGVSAVESCDVTIAGNTFPNAVKEMEVVAAACGG